MSAPAITVDEDPVALRRTITATGTGTLAITRLQSRDGLSSSGTLARGPSPLTVIDADFELGATASYTASDSAGTTTVYREPTSAGGCVLTVPRRPDLGHAVVTVLEQPSWSWSGPGLALEPLDHGARVIDPARMGTRRGPLALLVPEYGPHPSAHLRAVREILRQGDPVLLRTAAPATVESVLMHIEGWTEAQDGAPGPARVLDIAWTMVVDPSWQPILVGRTWAMAAADATWATIDDLAANWQELSWSP